MVYILAFFLVFLWIIVLRQKNDILKLKQQVQFILTKESDKSKIDQEINNSHNNLDNSSINATKIVHPAYNPLQSQQGYINSPTQYMPETKANQSETTINQKLMEEKLKDNTESWFGRNVIGIVASILIFIGLISLGVLAYEHITVTGKIIAMYFISIIILVSGIGLTLKWRNNFTLILTGCGCGSFFISILLTHVYFNRINDITAFSLLLVWMTATLYLSKKISSTLLSIVAHIGMVISICFAYALGLSDEKLAILLIYQGVSTAIILLGNTLLCRKTYNFGIVVSLAVTVIASIFMCNRFTLNSNYSLFAFTTSLPTIFIAISFLIQFLCACFLSYLLSISTNRLKNNDTQIIIHCANKLLWITSLIINVCFVIHRIVRSSIDNPLQLTDQQNFITILTAVLITIAVILIHSAITIILSIKFGFSKRLELISIFLLSSVTSILLLNLWGYEQSSHLKFPCITWLFVVSLLLILVRYITKNKVYLIGASAVLVLDAIFMFYSGYKKLNNFGTIFLSLGYLILINAIILLQWYKLDSNDKTKHSILIRLFSYFFSEISLIVIMLSSSLNYKTVILLIILTALNTLLYIIRYDRDKENSSIMKLIFKLSELILLFVDSYLIAYAYKDSTSTVLYYVLSALAFGLAFIRIRSIFDSNNSIICIWTGLKLSVLVLAVIQGNTTWFEQTYIFSVVCMLTALLCIIFGFIARAKALRLYGLALTLLCVIKLVTYDVSNLESILRVFAFIGGGIICFVISAIYNYTTKRLTNTKETPHKTKK